MPRKAAWGYAYIANGYSGLRVVDISTPADSTEVGFYDMPGDADGVAVAGGYAYVADQFGGLLILHYTEPERVYLPLIIRNQ